MSDGTGITRAEIRALTEARLTFGARGRALETGRALGFALDHAKARAAVLSEIDTGALGTALERAGLPHHVLTSEAATRDTYIRRPDLGRLLPEGARDALPRPADGRLLHARRRGCWRAGASARGPRGPAADRRRRPRG